MFPSWIGVALGVIEGTERSSRCWVMVELLRPSQILITRPRKSPFVRYRRRGERSISRCPYPDLALCREARSRGGPNDRRSRDLTKYFGALHVLKASTLDVTKGELLSIIGASASGQVDGAFTASCPQRAASRRAVSPSTDTDVHAKGTDINKLRAEPRHGVSAVEQLPQPHRDRNVALAPRIVKGLPRPRR